MVTNDLIIRARAGDGAAFRELVAPYERELEIHCYRFLGSAADAQDALQETLLAAWQGLGGFEERSSIRTWLYRVATSRCLNALRSRKRRRRASEPPPDFDPPEPTRLLDVGWLEPYPDLLLEGVTDDAPGPDARYEMHEAVSLAFVTALQLLPPRQRAVLILRDVLGFHAAEVAEMLDITEQSASSALKRARSTLQAQLPSVDADRPPGPESPEERALVAQLAHALETSDVDELVGLLTDDVLLRMPPMPLEYQGRDLAGRFFGTVAFRNDRRYHVVVTRANGQPAFGLYLHDPRGGILHANGLMVVTLRGDRVSALTRFENGVLARFGLPRTLPDDTTG
ncbi:MAG TPA: RNA polymerase subunit sigma-70 [Acidimicrobiia bacterium]